MSKRVSNPKLGAVPKQPQARKPASRPGSAGASRPSSSGRPGSSGADKTTASTKSTKPTKPPTCPAAAAKFKKEQKEQPTPTPKKYENPAFSIPLKRVHTNPLLAEKDKKKTIRRNIPPGEDLAGIKKILTSLKDKDVTVAEFVSLIAPSTGDDGQAMRSVLIEDMNTFRTLARRIYDTMTQDVSDVLTNQHIQLKEFEQEKTTLYTEKMMRAINEIYSYSNKFDFEEYYRDPKGYLDYLFPVPPELAVHSEEAEMCRRQQMFHRFNWLKTEGSRLSAENTRLKARLTELKEEQQQEMFLAEEREAEAEARREQLLQEEAQAQQQLEQLTDRVEKTIIDAEATVRVVTDEANILAPPQPKKTGAIRKTTVTKRKKARKEWVVEAATEVDVQGVEETMMAESSQLDSKSETLAGAIRKAREKAMRAKKVKSSEGEEGAAGGGFHFSPIKTPPSKAAPPKERSPFHFSPIKTPPQQPQARKPPSPFHFSPIKTPPPQPRKPPSPFHFSPIKTPPQQPQARGPPSPFHFSPLPQPAPAAPQATSPPQLQTTRLRTERVTVQETTIGASARPPTRQAAPQPPARGRQHAPRDQWGGFY